MKQPDYRKTDRLYGFSGELGAIYSAGRTEFRVWSPLAHEACVLLYRCADSPGPFAQISMRKSGGVWYAAAYGNLHGTFYTYDIDHRETIDIYARGRGERSARHDNGYVAHRPARMEEFVPRKARQLY